MAIVVKLTNKNTEGKSYEMTSDDNTIHFDNVEHGTYQVELIKDGVSRYIEDLVVNGAENMTVQGHTHIFINDETLRTEIDKKQNVIQVGKGLTKEGDTLSVDKESIPTKEDLKDIESNILAKTVILYPKTLVNLVKNGDFSDNLNYWNVSSSIQGRKIANGAQFTGTGPLIRSSSNHFTQEDSISDNPNNKIYLFVEVSSSNGAEIEVGIGYQKVITKTLSTKREVLSDIGSSNFTQPEQTRFAIGANPGAVINVYRAVAINLTSIYGLGKEPPKEQMDVIMKDAYFFNKLDVAIGKTIV
ncbi:hypothetical protein [Facklamia sp. 7083-14-GEN3]|uniref:hypothetical protein n=1 Tax=Facklamia sp. 7083-14-GEN3 TaxID=2973478 RepID=UPI00215C7E2C|nr:hypothetical protein [Facklamia sp. 7083-14-GEN3]MCR8969267.1 hypothetical protein [Facklamia sp. 7083-14-GEN3]